MENLLFEFYTSSPYVLLASSQAEHRGFILRGPGALSIKLYVVLARCLWLGIQRENNGLQTTSTSQAEHKSFILRGPGKL